MVLAICTWLLAYCPDCTFWRDRLTSLRRSVDFCYQLYHATRHRCVTHFYCITLCASLQLLQEHAIKKKRCLPAGKTPLFYRISFFYLGFLTGALLAEGRFKEVSSSGTSQ